MITEWFGFDLLEHTLNTTRLMLMKFNCYGNQTYKNRKRL